MMTGPDALRELIRRLRDEIDESQWRTDTDSRQLIHAGMRVALDQAVKLLNELEPPPLIQNWHTESLEP